MSSIFNFPAPAKINLTLRITGRRSDGFHDLDSIFCPLTLHDTVTLDTADCAPGDGPFTCELSCSDESLPVDDTNLAIRAAHLFNRNYPLTGSLRVHLEKRIPHGAGLGGGSSNAATVLTGLNQLFHAEFDEDALVDLAAELGSDVPFFIRGTATRCLGRGEILGVEVPLPSLPILLVKPPFPVPTPWAYQRFAAMKANGFPENAEQQLAWTELVNDLEPPVHGKFLVLAELKAWWLDQPEVEGALLSGSGSTTFAVLHEEADGEALRRRTLERFGPEWWSWLGAVAINEEVYSEEE